VTRQQRDLALLGVRRPSGEALDEDGGQGVDAAAARGLATLDLLRGDVLGPRRDLQRVDLALAGGRAAQPEVGQQDPLARSGPDRAGTQVAVDEARVGRGVQPRRRRLQHTQRPGGLDLLVQEQVAEARALDPLHGDVEALAPRADLEHPGDRGVLQPRLDLRLLVEAAAEAPVAAQVVGHELEGHGHAVACPPRLVDHARLGLRAEQALDLVAGRPVPGL
jgi:hypothetical protein